MDKVIMEKKIIEYQELLNRSDVVSEECFRRNHIAYPLISYVNNVTALFISRNFKTVPIFLDRAVKEIDKIENKVNISLYTSIVLPYLEVISLYLVMFSKVEQNRIDLIPSKLLNQE